MFNLKDYINSKKNARKNRQTYKTTYTTGRLTERIIQHRLRIFMRTVIIIIAVSAVVLATVVSLKNRTYSGYEIVDTVERKEVLDAACMEYNGNILTYSRDGVSCTNTDGVVLWNQTFEMQSPIMDMEGDKVAFGDYNGSVIYVMDANGPVGQIDTMMPIRNFCISSSGVVAAVLDEGNVTWIYLFDAKGNTIAYFKTTMKKSGYPVSIAISPNGLMVQVSYLYVESGYMRSSVAFYNFGPVGQNEIDNFVGGYDYTDTIVPFVRFLDDRTAFAVGDSRLMMYEGAQIPTSSWENLLTEEIQKIYYSENYIALVYYDVTGETTYRMDIYGRDGKIVDTVKFNIEYTDIKFQKDKVIIYDEMECLIHYVGGADIFSAQFEKGVLAVIPTSAFNRYVLVTADSIDTIELK
ncbi:MAG: hypothetical protein GX234_00010 [Clostridiales bacterium]|nr:hypothetical protein [Clostridiales bacterium]